MQLDVLKALGDNTRYAIYLELARSPHPLTTAQISDGLGLHPNTVRPHLERMRDVGLLDVEVGGRGDVGRPQHRYSTASDSPSLGLEPPTMPLLARMVLAMAQRLDGHAADAEAVGRAEGANRASPFERAPSTLEALVSDLDRLGFDPVVTAAPDDESAAVVAFANCPFARAGRAVLRSRLRAPPRPRRRLRRRDGRRRGPRILPARQPHAVPRHRGVALTPTPDPRPRPDNLYSPSRRSRLMITLTDTASHQGP